MIAARARGNALIFVLMLIAVIMLIIYAATTLQPLQARALDQHLHALTLESALDSATEEALANLQAGRSPEFASDVSIDGQTTHIAVKQLSAKLDEIELQLTSQLTTGESETRTARVFLSKGNGVWYITANVFTSP